MTDKEKLIPEDKAKVVLFVAGGYHAPGLSEILEKENLTFITVAPKQEAVDLDHSNDYLNVFTRGKIPLDKLFKSPKISIAAPASGVSI